LQDLHFVSAPHTLPLQEGQAVPMRAWWRHWHVSPSDEPQHLNEQQQQQQQQQQELQQRGLETAGHQQLPPQQQQDAAQQQLQRQDSALQQQASLHGKERELEVQCMMAAGWEAVVLRDWSVSLQHLCDVWQAGPPRLAAATGGGGSSSSSSLSSMASSSTSSSRNNAVAAATMAVDGTNSSTTASQQQRPAAAHAVAQAANTLEFDGVLGFSNGAAAAFLFVAHAAAHPERFRSLRFVALAGGYVPEPLEKLIPQQLLSPKPPAAAAAPAAPAAAAGSGSSSSSSDVAPADRLSFKLPFASLHMMGSNDPLMDVADSSQLMECFQEHGR
jgi:dienelactone hydrolase